MGTKLRGTGIGQVQNYIVLSRQSLGSGDIMLGHVDVHGLYSITRQDPRRTTT